MTTPGNVVHAWVCAGCTSFIVGVQRPIQSDDPEAGQIVLEAKIV